MSSASAVDHQRAVAALADARRTRCARAIPRVRAKSSRWAATIRRQAPSQCVGGESGVLRSGHRGHARQSSTVPPNGRHAAPMRSARSPRTARARCWSSAPPGRAAPRRWRCGSRRWPRAATRARARARPHPLASGARLGCASAPRRCSTAPTRSSGSTPTRRRPRRCCASTRSRPGSTRSSPPSAPADRLAILLDRLDELPLRRHEIRGNPAGLLARLLRRIDLLKAEAVAPLGAARVGGRRRARRRRAPPSASAPSARSSSPSSTPATTGSCARPAASTAATWCSSWASCSRDRADVAAAVTDALRRRARRRARGRRDRPPRAARGARRRTATSSAPAIRRQATRRFRGAGEASARRLPRRPPGASPRSTSARSLRAARA